MHPSIHCSTIYNSQGLETVQLPIGRGVDKKAVVPWLGGSFGWSIIPCYRFGMLQLWFPAGTHAWVVGFNPQSGCMWETTDQHFHLISIFLSVSLPSSLSKVNGHVLRWEFKKKTSLWYICTIEYYSAIKRKEILPFVTALMDLESITLSEIRQSAIWSHLYVEFNGQNNLTNKIETEHRYIEQTDSCQRGGDWGLDEKRWID